ncbi:MAG: porphobilinogen synthase [Deltaproteobacteria bacterium]|nr:porphobilinogen synthase [Deltaproteobacteria bacterium]
MAQDYLKSNSISLRRLRQSNFIRDLTQEVKISHKQFLQPLFVVQDIAKRESIPALTGVFRETPDTLITQIESDIEAGVQKFLLFGVPSKKTTNNFNFDFCAQQIQNIKKHFGKDVFLAVDVCLCSFTEHGHCGILSESDHIENDSTVSELVRAACTYAEAGADCVAPSDMMDGRVRAIRSSLDARNYTRTLIMSYSAKFHSKFYGPFRIAANSAPNTNTLTDHLTCDLTDHLTCDLTDHLTCDLTDRATYQIDPARPKDAFLSSLRDAEEGADILMVKPGLPYLDILSQLTKQIPRPWAVYEVSGEYAAIELLAEKKLIAANAAHLEAWIAFARAGASMIISYGARNAKNWIYELLAI